ncbi:sialate O-acetylesterase [Paenibacillus oceani]|uniref:Sialate O-acetylesterase domain-containing protein n=1 Tax=Paenibacillus oceani TaxID=2772510 RepID=A0A927C796_9BACL|nr:sialate O-acetylesterase [Paenibacillus oceani]MBD2862678.1 hypothetical protein [Paenibacillus oceani]
MKDDRENALTVSRLFSDHAVIQRRKEIQVWGSAPDGTEVTVTFAGRTRSAIAESGRWSVRLDPMEAGGPYELRITDGEREIVARDVLVGEVWVAGGQSNMGYSFSEIGGVHAEGECEELNGSHDSIRLFKAAEHASDCPETDFAGGDWKRLSAGLLPGLAAIPVYFAIELQRRLNVPIGIVQLSRAGTKAACWVPRRLAAQPEFAYLLEEEAVEREKLSHENPHRPFALYHGTVIPAQPFAIRGFIWYQGESDALEGKADRYSLLFPALIDAWRDGWDEPDAPFLFVQLPGYDKGTEQWAIVREAQRLAAKQVPHTGMAVTIDLEERGELHPKRKRPVVERLALLAGAIVYGDRATGRGPELLRAYAASTGTCVTFDIADSALAIKAGEPLDGFELCGEDGRFVSARAEVVGPDTVRVLHDELAEPVRIRYGWAAAPIVRLTNREGNPASPFRTDINREMGEQL